MGAVARSVVGSSVRCHALFGNLAGCSESYSASGVEGRGQVLVCCASRCQMHLPDVSQLGAGCNAGCGVSGGGARL